MKPQQAMPISIALLAIQFFGLIAGFFFAYSVDVMPALDTLSPVAAIDAMQAVNTMVRNPVFFLVFFGTPVIGALAAVMLYRSGQGLSALLMVIASIIYTLAAFLPTAAINVPMNEALGMLALNDPSLNYKQIWTDYSPRWTFWNTSRTLASLVALLFASLSLATLCSKTD